MIGRESAQLERERTRIDWAGLPKWAGIVDVEEAQHVGMRTICPGCVLCLMLPIKRSSSASWMTESPPSCKRRTSSPRQPLPEFFLAVAEEIKVAVERAGSEAVWRELSPEELAAKNISIQAAVAQRLGEATYQAMPPHERQAADLFVHSGCCMHKDLHSRVGRRAWRRTGQPPDFNLQSCR